MRTTIDAHNEKIGRKIRDNEMQHIPYLLIAGEKELAEKQVSVRKQGGEDLGTMTYKDFANKVLKEVDEMTKVS